MTYTTYHGLDPIVRKPGAYCDVCCKLPPEPRENFTKITIPDEWVDGGYPGPGHVHPNCGEELLKRFSKDTERLRRELRRK